MADRKPLARKGVLLLTIFPVIAGLAANEAYAVANGFLPLKAVLPIWALQAALTALFLFSYWQARKTSQAAERHSTLMVSLRATYPVCTAFRKQRRR